MLGYISNTISFVVHTGLVAVSGIALFAYFTKPSDESFKPYFKRYLGCQIDSESDGLTNKLLKKSFLVAGVHLIKPEIKDYIIFKTAEIQEHGKDMYFIGAFQNWYPN